MTPVPPLPAILIVDDEPRSLESLRRTLEEDFTVFTATSAEEALAVLRGEFVQVVVCDQRMPGQSGVEFLKRVRADWPDVVRIILSAYHRSGRASLPASTRPASGSTCSSPGGRTSCC